MKPNIKDFLVLLSISILFFSCKTKIEQGQIAGISIYSENKKYWACKGDPVLLLGGSNDDNLFQWPEQRLIPHLDSIKMVGANYLRNTMSDRKAIGFEKYPYFQMGEKKYDLGQWDSEYWNRFERFLKETSDRDIIVQIEIWDRFDYSREHWMPNPYNPSNNINYTYEGSGFDKEYPNHPGRNQQPFFFTTPPQKNNVAVLKYQQQFVDKLLSISLNYDNVLYCMDNETSAEEAWGRYWAEYIKAKAGNKTVYVTEMWDAHNLLHKQHKRTLDHPELYDFVDISQNSWNKGYDNWSNSQKIMDYLGNKPRPVNSVKIYGNDDRTSHLDKGVTTKHATETFVKNIVAGFASSRFHRPSSGLGLSEASSNCIRSIRMAETKLNIWELSPRMDLLGKCDKNEAYLAANPGKSYLIYFTATGSVELDLSDFTGTGQLDRIDLEKASWVESSEVKGVQKLVLKSTYEGGVLVILNKK